jgi:hypothetical protein
LTQKAPELRYSSADDVSRDLQAWLDGGLHEKPADTAIGASSFRATLHESTLAVNSAEWETKVAATLPNEPEGTLAGPKSDLDRGFIPAPTDGQRKLLRDSAADSSASGVNESTDVDLDIENLPELDDLADLPLDDGDFGDLLAEGNPGDEVWHDAADGKVTDDTSPVSSNPSSLLADAGNSGEASSVKKQRGQKRKLWGLEYRVGEYPLWLCVAAGIVLGAAAIVIAAYYTAFAE